MQKSHCRGGGKKFWPSLKRMGTTGACKGKGSGDRIAKRELEKEGGPGQVNRKRRGPNHL